MAIRKKPKKEAELAATGQVMTQVMTPDRLASSLSRIIEVPIRLSVMIWGAPGIGKSSIVAKVAQDAGIGIVDLRLSQLAPTDLRGLPVADAGVSRWYPPEFLPREGRGILFLDEINMAPPAVQGISQQLILDRRVGSYVVPDGWFIWAAGNRSEDHASVFEMPAPLSNRFIHFEVNADFESFKQYAISCGVHETIIGFLSFRPSLLHQPDETRPAWPSPRSWFMANQLYQSGMSIHPAVGAPAAAEFEAYLEVYRNMPNLDAICAGSESPGFPSEPSARYGVSFGLAIRAQDAKSKRNALLWIIGKAPIEWQSVFLVDLFRRELKNGTSAAFVSMMRSDNVLKNKLTAFRDLLIQ